jgi:branched-chain amino acid transport system permease protein
MGSFVAACAGALWGYKYEVFDAASFPSGRALGIIAFAYIGGIAMVSGAFIAGALTASGIFFELLPHTTGGAPVWQTFAAGVGMIVVAIKYPGGIASAGPAIRRRITAWRAREDRPPPASTFALDAADLVIDDSIVDDDYQTVELGQARRRPRPSS